MRYLLVLSYFLFIAPILLAQETNNAKFTEVQRKVAVIPLPFNSTYDDFAPAFYKDGIIFVSNRANKKFIPYVDEQTGNDPFDLFFVNYDTAAKTWNSPVALEGDVNSNVNEGPLSVSRSGALMYFTRNLDYQKKFGDINSQNLGIFRAEHSSDGKWNNITPLPFNNEHTPVGHPSISPDGSKIYFSAKLEDSFGGADLYVSVKKADGWAKPENLGPTINTAKDEKFPFFASDGTLYFASEGHNSKGGLDIFYTKQNGKDWIKVKPMQRPVNTRSDDYGLIFDPSTKTGYFSSNRENNVENIFQFKVSVPYFTDCPPIQENDFCYTFFEESGNDLDGMPFVYEWDVSGKKYRGLEVEHCFTDTGTYNIVLNLVDTTTNEIYFEEANYSLDIQNIEQAYIFANTFNKIDQEVFFDGSQSYLPNFKIDNYYWSFDDGNIQDGVTVSHQYRRKGEYQVQLGVVGHLPNKPFEEVGTCVTKKVIIAKGSMAKRRANEFKGEQQEAISESVTSNSSQKLENDEYYSIELADTTVQITAESGYFAQLDELKEKFGAIREYYNEEDGTYIYTIGSEKDLLDIHPLYKEIHQKGFKEAKVTEVDNETIGAIVFTPIEYKFFFQSGNVDIQEGDEEFNDFATEIERNIKIEGKVRLLLEASASKVPVKGNKSNIELAAERAKEAKSKLIFMLKKRGVDISKIIFEKDQVLVQGPEYKNDYETNKAVYQQYQYVKVVRILKQEN